MSSVKIAAAWVLIVVFGALCAVPWSAQAQHASSSASTSDSTSSKGDSAAQTALKRGELMTASTLFFEAYHATRQPPLLFNAARAAQRGALSLEVGAKVRALKTARKYYIEYVALPDSGPAGRKRAALHLREIEQLLRLLEQVRVTPSVSTAQAVSIADMPAPRTTWHGPTAVSLGVASLLLAGLSVWWAGEIEGQQIDLDSRVNNDPLFTYDSYRDEQHTLNEHRGTMRLLIGSAVATAALGATTWVLRPAQRSRASVSLEVGAQTLTLRF